MESGATPDVILTAVERPECGIEDFEEIVRLHRPAVFRFVLASVRDRDAAESLTQDCFLKAHQSRERFRGDCAFRTWLMQIAVNLVRDYGRNRRLQFWRRTRASALDVDEAGPRIPDRGLSPEARASAREQLEAVWQATGRLPERQRTVFLLRFVEDMDVLEIAAATGMAEGTVKVHLFRALRAVRERIGRRE
jgi:RNA polymerase sigma-70 factor, ECF subfamily